MGGGAGLALGAVSLAAAPLKCFSALPSLFRLSSSEPTMALRVPEDPMDMGSKEGQSGMGWSRR